MRDRAEEEKARAASRVLNPNLLDHPEPSLIQQAKSALDMQRAYKLRKRSAKPIPFRTAVR